MAKLQIRVGNTLLNSSDVGYILHTLRHCQPAKYSVVCNKLASLRVDPYPAIKSLVNEGLIQKSGELGEYQLTVSSIDMTVWESRYLRAERKSENGRAKA